jgi:hypothetical protein
MHLVLFLLELVMRLKQLGILLATSFLVSFAHAEKVICPGNLAWSFSGMQCAKLAGKEASCPAPSTLSKPSVLGPALCVSRGKCLGGGVPNSVGTCTVQEIKVVKTFPFTQITHL